jgi:hypothetical protein
MPGAIGGRPRADEIADGPVVGVELLEVLLTSKVLAPQLRRGEPFGMKRQNAREHGALPRLIRDRHRSFRLQARRICTGPSAVMRSASIC